MPAIHCEAFVTSQLIPNTTPVRFRAGDHLVTVECVHQDGGLDAASIAAAQQMIDRAPAAFAPGQGLSYVPSPGTNPRRIGWVSQVTLQNQ